MNTLTITVADESHFDAILGVAQEVWPIAYRDVITREQIAYMLKMMYDRESLLRQRNVEGCEFLIAKRGEQVVGFSSTGEYAPGKFKLHKLYVLTTEQGRGTGRMLMDEVCERAIMRGGKTLELQVNKKNTPAIRFYEKNNFIVDHEDVFDIGNGFVMDDYIMVKVL